MQMIIKFLRWLGITGHVPSEPVVVEASKIGRKPRVSQALRESRQETASVRRELGDATLEIQKLRGHLSAASQREAMRPDLHPLVSRLEKEIVGLQAAVAAEAAESSRLNEQLQFAQREASKLWQLCEPEDTRL